MIDKIDRNILKILQENGRTPNAEIARKVGLAPSAVFERLRKLEAAGIILGYTVRLNPKALKLGMMAFVFVRTDERVGATIAAEELAKLPEVLELYNVAGEDCYLLKLRAESPEDFARVLREKFGPIPKIQSTRSTIVLMTLKESCNLPLPPAQKSDRAREEK